MTDLTNWDDDILTEDETDDGIIELTDIVDEGSDEADNETIIELTDIVEKDSADLDMDSGDANVDSGLDREEDANKGFDLNIEEDEDTDFGLEIEEEVISLDMDSEEETMDFDLDIVAEENTEVEKDLPSDTMEFVSKGLELETDDFEGSGVEEVETQASVQDYNVSQEQIEAALERVIEKKFADKIDGILLDVMENVIGKEISKIKESLLKDFDHNGTV